MIDQFDFNDNSGLNSDTGTEFLRDVLFIFGIWNRNTSLLFTRCQHYSASSFHD